MHPLQDIRESCEPTMFSVEQLVFAIANDQRSNHDTLVQVLPMISDIYDKEKEQREVIKVSWILIAVLRWIHKH